MCDETHTVHPLESEFMLSMLQLLDQNATCGLSQLIMKIPVCINQDGNVRSISFEKEQIEKHIAHNEKNRAGRTWIIHPTNGTNIYKDNLLHGDKVIKGYPTSINIDMKNMIEKLIKNIQVEFEKYIWDYNVQNHPKYHKYIKLIQEYKKETKDLKGACIFGDEKSMEQLMETLYNNGIQEDKEQALKWAEKLKEHYHNDSGKFRIAFACNIGECGYEIDTIKARNIYEDLAQSGNIICMYNAGTLYSSDKNTKKAFEWFEKGYINNSLDCSVMYAKYCYEGIGCKVNKKKAFEIYQSISKTLMKTPESHIENEVSKACYNYGIMLMKERDCRNGIKYIDYAANNGNSDAQNTLNTMYNIEEFKHEETEEEEAD
uniref:Uncharacterized protein n=1 Tax=viral metagenome TaxID=1070528 RepID=A0A6C0KKA4_9ZZZZ